MRVALLYYLCTCTPLAPPPPVQNAESKPWAESKRWAESKPRDESKPWDESKPRDEYKPWYESKPRALPTTLCPYQPCPALEFQADLLYCKPSSPVM